jgi:hypothetical protein
MATQQIVVSSANPVEFIKRVIELSKQGAVLKDNTCPRLRTLPFIAEFTFELSGTEELKTSPGVNAIPVALSDKVYTKEQLEAMPIEEMRIIVASRGVRGRDKSKMVKQYLAAVESGKNADESSSEDG